MGLLTSGKQLFLEQLVLPRAVGTGTREACHQSTSKLPVYSLPSDKDDFSKIAYSRGEDYWEIAAYQLWGRASQLCLQRWIISVIFFKQNLANCRRTKKTESSFLSHLQFSKDVNIPLLLHILIIPFNFRCQQIPIFPAAVPTAQLREEARALELSHIPHMHTPPAKHHCAEEELIIHCWKHHLLLAALTLYGILRSKDV